MEYKERTGRVFHAVMAMDGVQSAYRQSISLLYGNGWSTKCVPAEYFTPLWQWMEYKERTGRVFHAFMPLLF
jgi:hypothetical protein